MSRKRGYEKGIAVICKISHRIEPLRNKPDSFSVAIACCYVYLGSRRMFGHTQYLCPRCGEKTFLDASENDFVRHLDKIHHFQKRMREKYGFSIQLDERYFCSRCCPPELEAESWIIEFGGKRFVRRVDDDDIPLLAAFFGKTAFRNRPEAS